MDPSRNQAASSSTKEAAKPKQNSKATGLHPSDLDAILGLEDFDLGEDNSPLDTEPNPDLYETWDALGPAFVDAQAKMTRENSKLWHTLIKAMGALQFASSKINDEKDRDKCEKVFAILKVDMETTSAGNKVKQEEMKIMRDIGKNVDAFFELEAAYERMKADPEAELEKMLQRLG